jgi:hypothetical protein
MVLPEEDAMRLNKMLQWRKWGATKKVERLTRKTKVRTLTIAAMCALGAVVVIAAATVRPQPATATHDQKNAAHDTTVVSTAGTSALPPTVAEAAAKAKLVPVTITGCLAREDAAYRLKDTEGDGAPQKRSWKSGFLKKGSASVDLYDTTNRVKLPAHVGERISVTGELRDREMYVRSIQRVSSSCKS